MGATFTIMRRELGAYFNTAMGYVIIVFFLLLTCYEYVERLFATGSADMRDYFDKLPMYLLLFVPAIAMRLWAEERKIQTLEVLLTLPIKSWQAVLGKWLAGVLFVALMLGLTLHLLVTLNCLGNPDNGTAIAGYIGALVLAMIYLAIGSFASSLTSDQIVAFVIGISVSLVFYLMGYPGTLNLLRTHLGADVAEIVQRFGVQYHFSSIARGVLDTRDVIYALSVCGLFLFLNVLVIERRR